MKGKDGRWYSSPVNLGELEKTRPEIPVVGGGGSAVDLVEGGLSVEEDVEPPGPVHASVEQLEIAQAATGAGEAFVVPAECIPGRAGHRERVALVLEQRVSSGRGRPPRR